MNRTETWPRCPEAAAFFDRQFRAFAAANEPVREMASRFSRGAGVDILALIDHWALPDAAGLAGELSGLGLVQTRTADGDHVWQHPQARLPRVRLEKELAGARLALGVEDVTRFLEANALPGTCRQAEVPMGATRRRAARRRW